MEEHGFLSSKNNRMKYKHYDDQDNLSIWQIDYTQGYYLEERSTGDPENWHPAESESTSINSVIDAQGNEIMETLDEATIDKIIEEVDEHLLALCEY